SAWRPWTPPPRRRTSSRGPTGRWPTPGGRRACGSP
ncbi:MAG: hypothetical protein AVDCRST_MAG13-1383, partial [uncultured Solirubrobacteraceae bacterium]